MERRNKRRTTTRPPEPRTTHLPPGVGGLGNRRAVDNIFPVREEEPCHDDELIAGSAVVCSTSTVLEAESCPELSIEDATDEQLQEVYSHLVREIASRNAKLRVSSLGSSRSPFENNDAS